MQNGNFLELLRLSTTNRGYFGGVKIGLEWFRETQGELPECVIVCNNDIRIEQPDFFDRLSSIDRRAFGVIAPRILSSSDEPRSKSIHGSAAKSLASRRVACLAEELLLGIRS
jgi:hypothetical protein